MMNPSISFIILTWNSEAFLRKCFDSIILKCTEEQITYEIIVIDNGSVDDSSPILHDYESKYPTVFHLILLDRNLGTTYPRNLGLKQARGEYICILDSDTELGQGSLTEVMTRISNEPSTGIIAPRLLLPNGKIQNSVKHFPTFLHKLIKIIGILLKINLKNYDFYKDFPFTEERMADTAISACWFFKKGLIQLVGNLDENIFYSPEDMDYSIRVWKAGRSILYFPSFTVLHHTQQITHKRPLSKTSFSHFGGLIYYYRKHGGWFKTPAIRQ